jgi:hypothetical protein
MLSYDCWKWYLKLDRVYSLLSLTFIPSLWLAEEMWVNQGIDGKASNHEDGRNQKMLLLYMKVEV